LKTTNTCTVYFEDGTEISYDNVSYSRRAGDKDERSVVRHYDQLTKAACKRGTSGAQQPGRPRCNG
jgi:hypothetical protein